ncbi:hypothetical protein N7533_002603 [Penicillium manginii]|jgi:hypothetical protein|uniref:uncharacterized protein n=1 Tax=Penicillium manginii TaxID=203109 RepID=UPI0025467B7A|nr:uncharacterized protein N7533_002603 [Penicillium manginii]KAJ5763922.1 hypothetical protein N7533_002603 [Penicillium manginii]
MATTLTSRALIWVALLSVLAPYCFAFQYSKSDDGAVSVSDEQDIYSAEAAAMVEDDDSGQNAVGRDQLTATSEY